MVSSVKTLSKTKENRERYKIGFARSYLKTGNFLIIQAPSNANIAGNLTVFWNKISHPGRGSLMKKNLCSNIGFYASIKWCKQRFI